jgi:putative PIN family toxin of toxin-antitoxin system
LRVILDTNVLASGFATRGLCADLTRKVMAEHDFITSEYILEELIRTLRFKFHVPDQIIESTIILLRRFPVMPIAKNLQGLHVRDKKDIPVLASALECNADVLVTGDRDLLILRKHGSLQIMSPRGFWDYLDKGEGGRKSGIIS